MLATRIVASFADPNMQPTRRNTFHSTKGHAVRARHFRWVRTITICAVTLAMFSLSIAAVAQGQLRTVPVTVGSHYTPTSNAAGCGNLRLLAPTETPSFYSQHPEALLPLPLTGGSIQTIQAVQMVDFASLHWVSSISCTAASPPVTNAVVAQQQVSGPSTLACQADCSKNWAGNQSADYGSKFFVGVTLVWYVPQVVEPSNLTVVSVIWPGIGAGTSADPLIQAGTGQDGSCTPGCLTHNTSYYFWDEVAPQENRQILHGYDLYPGDEVGSIVEYDTDNNTAYFTLIDYTRNYLIPLQYIGVNGVSGNTAEWIIERYESCNAFGCNVPSLMNFGTETLYNAQGLYGSPSAPAYASGQSLATAPGGVSPPWTMVNCPNSLELASTNGWTDPYTFSVNWDNYGTTESFPC